jgi:hypothetical protein
MELHSCLGVQGIRSIGFFKNNAGTFLHSDNPVPDGQNDSGTSLVPGKCDEVQHFFGQVSETDWDTGCRIAALGSL